MWGFNDIGLALSRAGPPAQKQCAEWIEMYASPEFSELTSWCRDILDRMAEGLPASAYRRLESAFVTSSRHELAFWDMAAE
jgi:thiaminase/transcriptional activator TenA